MDSPHLAAIIEVMADAQGSLPVELIRDAYCASRCGTIALVLNGVLPQAVDRVLDKVVAETMAVHGVLYCDPQCATSLVARLSLQGLAVASTEPLRTLLATRRARLVPVSEAHHLLTTLSRGRRRRLVRHPSRSRSASLVAR